MCMMIERPILYKKKFSLFYFSELPSEPEISYAYIVYKNKKVAQRIGIEQSNLTSYMSKKGKIYGRKK